MGSIIIAAVAGEIASSIALRLLNGTCLKPGTIGPKLRLTFSCPVAEIPARVRPWKELIAVRISNRPSSCPYLRTNLKSPSFASAPLLQKNTLPGPILWTSLRASSPCCGM